MFLTHFSLEEGLILPPSRLKKTLLNISSYFQHSERFLLKEKMRPVSSPPWLPAIIWVNEDVVVVRVVLWKMMVPWKYCHAVLSSLPKLAFFPLDANCGSPLQPGMLTITHEIMVHYFISALEMKITLGPSCHTRTQMHYTCVHFLTLNSAVSNDVKTRHMDDGHTSLALNFCSVSAK